MKIKLFSFLVFLFDKFISSWSSFKCPLFDGKFVFVHTVGVLIVVQLRISAIRVMICCCCIIGVVSGIAFRLTSDDTCDVCSLMIRWTYGDGLRNGFVIGRGRSVSVVIAARDSFGELV